MIGHTISHYKITAKLGEGGMGVVYKAEDTKLDRPVALKFLAPHLLRDEEARKRFEREAKAAARLDHPNICTVYEIDEAEGRTFIVMAFLEGRPLSEKIKEGPLKLSEALSVAIQTADGLEAAHEKGITHRDIKPDNLMLMTGSRWLVKVMDFGLAQLAGGSKFTREGTTLGTMTYMSPEQAAGAETDNRTDIWSLGVVLYEMVAGQPPFRGDYDQVVVYSLMNETPEPLTAVRTGVPKELERVVNKCLAKEPGERYQRVDELLVDLRGLQKEQQAEAATRARPAAEPPASRRTVWYVGAAALALALISAFVGSRFSAPDTPEPQTSLVATPLTSFVGTERAPTFSPNGEQVAFTWNGEDQDNFDIWVQTIAGGPPLRLTTHSADDFQPAWSPDGLLIAFVRGTQGQFGQAVGKASLLVIPSVGGPARAIGEVAGGSLSAKLTWTRESKALIVSDQTQAEGPRLFVLSIETGERRQLTESPEGEFEDLDPALSPDGRTLAFARRSSFRLSEIHTLPLSEDLVPMGEAQQLTSLEQSSLSPEWTPDGSRILFSSAPAGVSPRIWSVPASGGERAEPVALPGEAATQPAISRRGNRLVYVQRRSRRDVQRLELGAARGTKPPTRILASTRGEDSVQFSPDGERIAFASRRSGPQGIFVADADGSNVKPLYVKEGELAGSPRWSPDGQRLVFDSTLAGHVDVFVISAQGGAPLRVTKASSDDALASWSRDGQWIYFSSDRSGRYEVWKISPTGGEPVQVTREGGGVPFESADGKHVYHVKDFELQRTSVWKVAVAGGEETQVLEPVFRWSIAVTEKGLYYIEPPDAGLADLGYAVRRFDFDSEETTTVWQLPPGRRASWQLTVSPGERELLYTEVGDSSSDLRLVENFQ